MKRIITVLLLMLIILSACSSKKEETANDEITDSAIEETKNEDNGSGTQSMEYTEMDTEWLKYEIVTPSEFFSTIKEEKWWGSGTYFQYFLKDLFSQAQYVSDYRKLDNDDQITEDLTNDLDKDIENLCSSMGDIKFAVVYGVYSGYFENKDTYSEYYKIPDQIEGYDVLAVGFADCYTDNGRDDFPYHIVCPERTMFFNSEGRAPIITGNSLIIFNGTINIDNYNSFINDSKLLIGVIFYEYQNDGFSALKIPETKYGIIDLSYNYGFENLIINDNCDFLYLYIGVDGLKKVDINAKYIIIEGGHNGTIDELTIRKNVKSISCFQDDYTTVHDLHFENFGRDYFVRAIFDNLVIDNASDNMCYSDNDYFYHPELYPNSYQSTIKNLSGKAIDWDYILDYNNSGEPVEAFEIGTIDYRGEYKLTIEGK